MKTTAIPAVRVEPALRDQMQQVLRDGETLSSFVEHCVREAVDRRYEDAVFVSRGLASIEAAKRSGDLRPVGEVMGRLKQRLETARRSTARKAGAKARAR
jgi:hypothetical protein